jgi:hypothetical protein
VNREDAIAQIVTVTQLREDDLVGFLACSPEEQQVLIAAYRRAGIMPSASSWGIVLDILKECAELAELVTPIGGAVQLVFQLAKL